MGLAGGATADDAEAEYIRSITEKDVVTGTSRSIMTFKKSTCSRTPLNFQVKMPVTWECPYKWSVPSEV